MSVRAMLTLIILRDINKNLIDFVLVYTQTDLKAEIFMELHIGFGVEGGHHREWVIRLDKKLYAIKDTVIAWF